MSYKYHISNLVCLVYLLSDLLLAGLVLLSNLDLALKMISLVGLTLLLIPIYAKFDINRQFKIIVTDIKQEQVKKEQTK